MRRYSIAAAVVAVSIAFIGPAAVCVEAQRSAWPGKTQQPAGAGQAEQPAVAAKWTRTYVVEWNEPAMYYGAKTGVTDPGTDCPRGTNPEPDWIKVLVDAGYTVEEAKWLRNPANPTRSPVHGQN